MAPSAARISIRNLDFYYGANKALKNINADFANRQVTGMIGPSGCGKSSLLHIIGGLTAPSDGHITVDGEDLLALSEAQRTEMRKKKIGFVFQRFNLLPTLTAYDNIALASHIAGQIGRAHV